MTVCPPGRSSRHEARAAALFAFGLLVVAPAAAGDFATLAPIGFSADGRVFAFEQYGIRDGSGFPYSTIAFVDLDRDAFVAPSPIAVSDEADGATLDEARATARARAKALFGRYRPETNPGLVAASNPPTEVSADPHRVVFRPRPFEPWPDEPVELRLERLQMAAATDCGAGTAGFRLTRRIGAADKALTVHEDKAIPGSRGCALDYAVSAVLVFGTETGAMRAVAMIAVRSQGFEGPDLRYLAQPLPLR